MHTTTTHSPTPTRHLAPAAHEAALSVSRWRGAKYRWIAALLTLLGGAVGCSPGDKPPDSWDPGPVTPTTVAPQPTASAAAPEPTTDPTAEAVQAAIQTLRDYIAEVDAVSFDAYREWEERLSQFWGSSAISAPLGAIYESYRKDGTYGEGYVQLSQIEPHNVNIIRGSGGNLLAGTTIELEYCADYSHAYTYLHQGDLLTTTAPKRFRWSAALNLGEDGRWRITREDAMLEEPC